MIPKNIWMRRCPGSRIYWNTGLKKKGEHDNSLEEALTEEISYDLGQISVPGKYAFTEAVKALKRTSLIYFQ